MYNTRNATSQAAKASEPGEQLQPADVNGIMEAIVSSERRILERIDSSTKDLNEKIQSLKSEMDGQSLRLQDFETGLNDYSDRTEQVESDVSKLKDEVAKLTQKLEDLEGRQRRCNARIIGVKEGFENTGAPTDVIASMLKETLDLNFVPMLDRAHRSLRQQAKDGIPPRPIVIKFHYFREREEVFRKANSSPLFLQGKRINIFPDYTADVAKKRAAFSEAKRLLRSCKDVRFGLLYPATLRITPPSGHEQRFTDPQTAVDFVKTKLLCSTEERLSE